MTLTKTDSPIQTEAGEIRFADGIDSADFFPPAIDAEFGRRVLELQQGRTAGTSRRTIATAARLPFDQD